MILNGLIVATGTVVAIAVALLSDSWRKNRQERASTSCDLHRDNIRRALDASSRYTGRAWSRSESSTPAVSAVQPERTPSASSEAASRGVGFLPGLADVAGLYEQTRSAGSKHAVIRRTASARRRVSPPVGAATGLLDPRNTNARAHGTGVR